MSLQRRRRAVLLVAVGGLLLAGSATGAVAQTGGGSQLGFFDVTADAAGIGATFGDPTSQPYPVAAGLAPSATAQFGAGPSGQAQASILWPGPLIGNAGSLANVIGTPLPPEVVSNLNYPVVARANAGGGGKNEQALGPMKAAVDSTSSKASTALTDFNAPGVVTAARVVTESVSALEDGKATSTATSELQGVDVGGVIKFGRVRTVAKGATDGVNAKTEREVEVAGVRVNGQAATVDEAGLHIGGQTIPAGAGLDGAKPALEPFGLSAYVTKPVEDTTNAGAGQLTSGAVVVVWEPPPPPDQFPDQLKSKSRTVVVLGGSSVKVSGTPGSELPGGAEPSAGFFSPPPAETVLPTPSFSPSAESTNLAPVESGGASVPGASAASPARDVPLQSGAGFEQAAAVSDRVPFGWVVLGFLGACLLGSGLHNFRQGAVAAPAGASRCPLESS